MRRRVLVCLLVAAGCAGWAAAAGAQETTARVTSCTACHGDADMLGEEGAAMVRGVSAGVHGQAGLSCHDCHGGNPDARLADDPDAAMDPGFAANPYRGVPARQEIPELCGGCHSDPTFMRRFRPDIRVDQVREYWTSHHGMALAAGDTRVATCVDCHGVHGILGSGNPESPVYPSAVAETCRKCHSDEQRMAGYTLANGQPLPTDQYAAWQRSVHARSLLERGDLSAPTCNDCHGNHGATPPGVDSITFVCGQCHGREAGLFRASSKQDGFEEHNEMLAGGVGCADCHDAAEPQAAVTRVDHFGECTSCHGNHAVVRPTLAMFGPLPAVPCAFCHEPVGGAAAVPEPEEARRHYHQVKELLVAEARQAGLEGEALFDSLVHKARELPFHTREGEDGRELKEEFARLFDKLRLGTTYFTYVDPDGGREVRQALVRCTDCHGPEAAMAESPVGHATSRRMLERLWELAGLTARAERIVLEARRGGVETRAAHEAVDRAVDSQIELQVLVHTFSAAEDSAFVEKHAEGLEHAQAALRLGQEARDELAFRRRGLAASLGIILLVLVALALKIRQLTLEERELQG
ncbi:MAG TPA: hypothetical protein VMT16_03805 [Thermoanaerobaculia bacterium]|nr:hypothetical protein [Thermoanaerobaculia bacterium]